MIFYKLGRFLQLVALLVTPAGILPNVVDPNLMSVKTSLLIAGAGVALFIVGWLLQQMGRPS